MYTDRETKSKKKQISPSNVKKINSTLQTTYYGSEHVINAHRYYKVTHITHICISISIYIRGCIGT